MLHPDYSATFTLDVLYAGRLGEPQPLCRCCVSHSGRL